jgi:hypothetical protein
LFEVAKTFPKKFSVSPSPEAYGKRRFALILPAVKQHLKPSAYFSPH